jgi:hypothetical protein
MTNTPHGQWMDTDSWQWLVSSITAAPRLSSDAESSDCASDARVDRSQSDIRISWYGVGWTPPFHSSIAIGLASGSRGRGARQKDLTNENDSRDLYYKSSFSNSCKRGQLRRPVDLALGRSGQMDMQTPEGSPSPALSWEAAWKLFSKEVAQTLRAIMVALKIEAFSFACETSTSECATPAEMQSWVAPWLIIFDGGYAGFLCGMPDRVTRGVTFSAVLEGLLRSWIASDSMQWIFSLPANGWSLSTNKLHRLQVVSPQNLGLGWLPRTDRKISATMCWITTATDCACGQWNGRLVLPVLALTVPLCSHDLNWIIDCSMTSAKHIPRRAHSTFSAKTVESQKHEWIERSQSAAKSMYHIWKNPSLLVQHGLVFWNCKHEKHHCFQVDVRRILHHNCTGLVIAI